MIQSLFSSASAPTRRNRRVKSLCKKGKDDRFPKHHISLPTTECNTVGRCYLGAALYYRPLGERTGLFREFAELKPTEPDIQRSPTGSILQCHAHHPIVIGLHLRETNQAFVTPRWSKMDSNRRSRLFERKRPFPGSFGFSITIHERA